MRILRRLFGRGAGQGWNMPLQTKHSTLVQMEGLLMSIKLRHISSLPILLLAARSENDLAVGSMDSSSNPAAGSDAAVSADLAEAPQSGPTLETGVDLAAFAATVTSQVIQLFSSTTPGIAPDSIQVGRPWGQFDVHKGPRLAFRSPYGTAEADEYVARSEGNPAIARYPDRLCTAVRTRVHRSEVPSPAASRVAQFLGHGILDSGGCSPLRG
jgi:hypothetical protein